MRTGQGAEDTHTLAQQAVSQATQTTNLATAAQTQAKELRDSVKEAARLAAATEEANSHSIDFDRPWIGIVFTPNNFGENKAATVNVAMINTGRRPAKITVSEYGAAAFPSFPENPPYTLANTPAVSSSTTLLVPNLHTDTSLNVSDAAVSKEYFAYYQAGTRTFFVYANVEYEDVVTHTKHWTHACMRYVPTTPVTKEGFYGCHEYNDVESTRRLTTIAVGACCCFLQKSKSRLMC